MVRDRYAFLFIVAVPLLLFAPDILSGRIVLPLDALHHEGPFSTSVPAELQRVKNPHLTDLVMIFFPWTEMLRTSKEIIPLWNPYSFCGSPLLANGQTGFLFPLTWLSYILPLGPATSIVAVSKLIFCGIFSYLFYRTLDFNGYACLLGALTYMLSGHLIVWLGYPTSFPIVSLPFLFWSLEKYLRIQRSCGLTWIALAYGLLFLGGQPQTGLVVALGSGIYFLVRTHGLRTTRPRLVFGLLISGLLGFCIAAPQILPFLEYLRESAAYRLRGTFGWKQYPWFTLLTWIVPRYFGDLREGNYWGFSSFLGEAVYIGGISLILANVGIMRARRGSHYWAVAAVSLLGFLGLYVSFAQWLCRHMPLLANIDNNKLIVLVTFGLVSFSVAGLNEILETRSSRGAIFALWNATALFWALFVVVGFIYFREPIRQLHLAAFEAKEIFIHAILLLAGCGVLWLWKHHRLNPDRLGLILISLVAFDLSRVWLGYYPSFPSEYARLRSRSVEFLRTNLGENRFLGLAGFLPPETSILLQLYDIRGYDGLTPHRYYEILGRMAPTTQDLVAELKANAPKSTEWTPRTLFYRSLEHYLNTDDPETLQSLRHLNYWSNDIRRVERPNLLSLLNVRYLLSPPGNPIPAALGFRLVHSSDADVWENPDALPKAFISTLPVFVESDDAALEAVSDAAFDFRKAAVICAGPGGAAVRQPMVGPEQARLIPVKLVRSSPHLLELSAESNSGGWLVLCDLFYPGWQATVDGIPTPIVPANYLFRGLRIAPGAHRVTFSYRPASFYGGVALAVVALVIVASILAKSARVDFLKRDI